MEHTMSITVRQWSQAELESLTHDKWLATVFMNGHTFSAREMEFYPYKLRKTYICQWEEGEAVTIYATDEKMLLKFIDAEYIKRPDTIAQKITQYRPVTIPPNGK